MRQVLSSLILAAGMILAAALLGPQSHGQEGAFVAPGGWYGRPASGCGPGETSATLTLSIPISGGGSHTHSFSDSVRLSSHTHSFSRTTSGHVHTTSAHTHSVGGHVHNLNSHRHTHPNHEHTMSGHTHSPSTSGPIPADTTGPTTGIQIGETTSTMTQHVDNRYITGTASTPGPSSGSAQVRVNGTTGSAGATSTTISGTTGTASVSVSGGSGSILICRV